MEFLNQPLRKKYQPEFYPEERSHTSDENNQFQGLDLYCNPNCYCTERQSYGYKTMLYTGCLTCLVVIIPLCSLIIDIVFYFRAITYTSWGSSVMSLSEINKIYNNSDFSLNLSNDNQTFESLVQDYDNCGAYDSINQEILLPRADLVNNNQTASYYDSYLPKNQRANTTIKYLIYNHNIIEFLRPILILGGCLSMMWVCFYRSVILLTNHKNILSTFASTVLYAIVPSVTFIACLNVSETLVGYDSIKCNACRKQQFEYLDLRRKYEMTTTPIVTTISPFANFTQSPPLWIGAELFL